MIAVDGISDSVAAVGGTEGVTAFGVIDASATTGIGYGVPLLG